MDAFEHLVSQVYEARGYWTKIGVKIDLSTEEKREVGNPTMPRPEIDVVAYKPKENELLVLECKSFLDSQGVSLESFNLDCLDNSGRRKGDKYKMFNNEKLRNLVLKKLVEQMADQGLLPNDKVIPKLGLVCGKIKNGDEQNLGNRFIEKGWLLVTPNNLRDDLRKFCNRGYENNVATVLIKLLLRD